MEKRISVTLAADETNLLRGFAASSAGASQLGAATEAAMARAASSGTRVLESVGQLTQSVNTGAVAAQAYSAAGERFVLSLDRQARSFGKTRSELLEMQAVELGVSQQAAPFIARLREQETALGSLGGAARAASMAAGVLGESEEQAAVRLRAVATGALERAQALTEQVAAARAAAVAERELSAATVTKTGSGYQGHITNQNRGFQELTRDINEVNAALTAIERGAGSQKTIQAQTDTLISLWKQGRLSAEQYEGAIKRLNVSEAALARSSEQATAQGDRFIANLKEQAATAGMSARQIMEYRAAQLGVGARAAPLIAQLDGVSKSMSQTGMSAHQTAASMRMVPAALGLITGQMSGMSASLLGQNSALIMMASQGSRLVDTFGGMGGAVRAFGASLGSFLTNPLTIGVAAVIGLGSAFLATDKRMAQFSQSLSMTNGYSGKSSQQLWNMSQSLGALVGSSEKAAAALNAVVSSGKFTGIAVEQIAQSAVLMEQATGQAVSQTIAQFEQLQSEPAKGLIALNQQYHFLTASMYEQVRALEEQGRKQEAANLAVELFSRKSSEMTKGAIENAGAVAKAWAMVTGAINIAATAVMNFGKDRPMSQIQEDLDLYNSKIKDEQARGKGSWWGGGANETAIERYKTEIAKLEAEGSRVQLRSQGAEDTAKIDASVGRAAKLGDAYRATLSVQQKLREEQKAAENDYMNEQAYRLETTGARDDELERRQRVIQDDFEKKIASAERKGAGPGEKNDAATTYLQRLREQGAVLQEQLLSEEKLGSAAQEHVKFEQMIADLKGKVILTAEEKSYLATEGRLRAQVQRNVAMEQEKTLRDGILKMEERSAQIQASMASANEGRRDQYDRQLNGIGMGKVEQERILAQKSLYKEAQRAQEQLDKVTPKDLLGSEKYLAEQLKIRDALQQSLHEQASYYASLDRLQSDWRNGAREAFSDYVDSANNAAQQSQGMFANMFQGMENSLSQMITTGKADFKGLATSIIADIARIQARSAVAGLASMVMQAFSGFSGATVGGSMTGDLSGMSVVGGGSWGSGFGARAQGGPVLSGKMYEVNEQGPELFSQKGRTYLMAGDSDGYVTPIVQGRPSGTADGATTMPDISVHNYGGAKVDVQRMSDGQIRMEIDRQIKKQTPAIMAHQQRSTNSRFSRAQQESILSQRRR